MQFQKQSKEVFKYQCTHDQRIEQPKVSYPLDRVHKLTRLSLYGTLLEWERHAKGSFKM